MGGQHRDSLAWAPPQDADSRHVAEPAPEPGAARPLIVATTLDIGRDNGPTAHISGLITRLSGLGFAVTVLCPRPSRVLQETLTRTCGFQFYPNSRAFGVPTAFSSILAIPALLRLRRGRLLYVRGSSGTLPLTWAARLLGFDRIMLEHNGWLRDEVVAYGYWPGMARLAEWFQVKEAKIASANRTVTRQLSDRLAERGVSPACLHVIENGVDTAVFAPSDRKASRDQFGIPDDDRAVLAFVGNLWSGAGLETVFQSLLILRRDHGELDFLIAGDGPARTELEAAASRILGAGHRVRFLGSLPPSEANIVLGAATLAVAPYKRAQNAAAGLSALKLRTYAAAGKPVVTSALPGMVELKGEPWLYLAESEDANSFANAIALAMQSDPARMAISARAYAERNDWAVAAAQIARLLAPEA
jgi:glycosyltransferase involved in cell wall biosynthesis